MEMLEKRNLESEIAEFKNGNYFHTSIMLFGIIEKHGEPIMDGDFVSITGRDFLDAVHKELGDMFTSAYIWGLVESNYSGAFYMNKKGSEITIELQVGTTRS
jgi:hypothetical protein